MTKFIIIDDKDTNYQSLINIESISYIQKIEDDITSITLKDGKVFKAHNSINSIEARLRGEE